MKKKYAYITVIGGLFILCFILFMLSLSKKTVQKDIGNVKGLTLAEALGESYGEIQMSISGNEITQASKELVLEVNNLSSYAFDVPKNEVTIDRYIDGEWYFWGICGTGYEYGEGATAGESTILNYRLSYKNLVGADYIKNYKEEKIDVNNKKSLKTEIIFFPGIYRVRLKGKIDKLTENGNSQKTEIVCKFQVH